MTVPAASLRSGGPVGFRPVLSPKDRLARLALLDRAFAQLSDDELLTLVESLPEEAATAVDHFASAAAPGVTGRIETLKAAASKGRMNGNLERVTNTITALVLNDCVEALGDHADLPSEDELREVAPALIEKHGLNATRVMLATVAAGDAPAATSIVRLLKHDDVLALPPVAPTVFVPTPPVPEDPERAAIRERRKADKKKKQVESALRRDQIARAKQPR